MKRLHSQMKKRVKKMQESLEEIQVSAKQAHLNRDRRSWTNYNEAVYILMNEAMEKARAKKEIQPALISKLGLSGEINRLIALLNEKSERLKSTGHFNDWHPEIRRILRGLSMALKKTTEMSEGITGEQALAKCRQIYTTAVKPFARAIDNLGVDISKAGQAVDELGQRVTINNDTKIVGGTGIIDSAALLSAGYASIFEAILQDGVDLNQQDADGCTALMISVLQGNFSLVCKLIDKGANVEIEKNDGRTALMLANTVQITERLLEACADINAADNQGVTALMLAAHTANGELVKFLIKKGALLESRWETGQTPLIIASYAGHADTVEQLISLGADVDACCNYQRTSMHYAAERGHLDVINILLQHSADINKPDVEGYTPTLHAARYEQLEVVKLFLDSGAAFCFKELPDLKQRLSSTEPAHTDRQRNLAVCHNKVADVFFEKRRL